MHTAVNDISGSPVFSPGRIGGRTAPNRLVSQAMEGNDGEDGGRPSARTLERYRKLAGGGWGVVVVEALSVTVESRARKNGLVLSGRTFPDLERLVDAFRGENNDCLLLFQITHSGRRSGPFSLVTSLTPDPEAHLLTTEEVEAIRNDFVEAALLAERAGADGVDFKLCHGYFGAEMLRPSNTRTDRWGGSFENRTRFLRESVEEIRAKLPRKDFIIGSRISMYEGIRGGCGTAGPGEQIEDLSDMKELIRLMERLGMAYVNVSAGIPGVTTEFTRPTKPSRHNYLLHFRYAKEAKAVSEGLAVIGSAYSVLEREALAHAGENIGKGTVDFTGFGRQSFADPLFPLKVLRGEPVDYCTACSGCARLMAAQMNDGCIVYDGYYRELVKTVKGA